MDVINMATNTHTICCHSLAFVDPSYNCMQGVPMPLAW